MLIFCIFYQVGVHYNLAGMFYIFNLTCSTKKQLFFKYRDQLYQ